MKNTVFLIIVDNSGFWKMRECKIGITLDNKNHKIDSVTQFFSGVFN
jgi:hypothetical protein